MPKVRTVVVVGVVLAVVAGSALVYAFVSYLPTSANFGPPPPSPVQITSVSCSVRNNSCELVMVNTGTATPRAGGCQFDSVFGPKNGVNNSVIVQGGSGILSDNPGGSVNQVIPIAPGASVIAYCTPAGSSPAAGTPVQGEVWWVEPGEDWQYPGFSATWA